MPSPINNNIPSADQAFVVFQTTTASQCSPSAPSFNASSTSSIEPSSSASSIEQPDPAPIHFEPFQAPTSINLPTPPKRWLVTRIMIAMFTAIKNLFINLFRVIAAMFLFISNPFLKLFGRDAESMKKREDKEFAKRCEAERMGYHNLKPNTTTPNS